MPKIHFTVQKKEIVVNSGANLREVALHEKMPLYPPMRRILNCHGLGLCGTCVVEVTKGKDKLSPVPRCEEKILKKKKLDPEKFRLACQCYVHADVSVKTLG